MTQDKWWLILPMNVFEGNKPDYSKVVVFYFFESSWGEVEEPSILSTEPSILLALRFESFLSSWLLDETLLWFGLFVAWSFSIWSCWCSNRHILLKTNPSIEVLWGKQNWGVREGRERMMIESTISLSSVMSHDNNRWIVQQHITLSRL